MQIFRSRLHPSLFSRWAFRALHSTEKLFSPSKRESLISCSTTRKFFSQLLHRRLGFFSSKAHALSILARIVWSTLWHVEVVIYRERARVLCLIARLIIAFEISSRVKFTLSRRPDCLPLNVCYTQRGCSRLESLSEPWFDLLPPL